MRATCSRFKPWFFGRLNPSLSILVCHVRAPQVQTELLDLLPKGLVSSVRGEPWTDFRKSVLGNIDGARLRADFEGERLGGVERAAVMTAARLPATAESEGDEGSGEHGGRGGEPFETCVEQAADEGGVIGEAQGGLQSMARRSVSWHSGKGGKSPGAKKK
jgi:hypothetical protein